MAREGRLGWLAPVSSALAFVILVVVFALELVAYREALATWALRDLTTRVNMAAATLREPLATSELNQLHRFAARCEEEGMRLTVFAGKGVFFDSRRAEGDSTRFLYAEAPSSAFTLRLGLPYARAFAPLRRATMGFLLAALAGGMGVLIVFFAFYRQRVRLAELARQEQFRRAFIADFSHELKTPLTGILGAADMLAEADEGSRPKLVEMIVRESRRLNSLAQGILDLARLERPEQTLQAVETDLTELVTETCSRFAAAVRAAGMKILHEEGTEPVVVRCDPQLVLQALGNLVTNALKYSRGSEVRLAVQARSREVLLTVQDNGVGIPESAREYLFERFYRADPARAAETGGAGLGLSIVKSIAQVHGGGVRFEPVVPQGARFILTLPLAT